MRFTQLLRRLGCGPKLNHPAPYRLTIIGSSSALKKVKPPLYQHLRHLGASVSKAQSSMLHENQHRYTSLTIHGTAQQRVVLNHLAQELGQKEGICRVHVDS